MSVYLIINGIEFKDDLYYQGEKYNILPSLVLPKREIIQTAERSIDGTVHVDITAVKRKLQVVFDYLEDNDFQFVLGHISPSDGEILNIGGFEISYYFAGDATENKKWYLESLDYTPLLREDSICWQNVTFNFIEM